LEVKDLYINTPINAMLQNTELLLTIKCTATSVQQTTWLLHTELEQYYLQFLNKFLKYEMFLHGIQYFLPSGKDFSKGMSI
jgi:hypothetical protein